VGALRFTEGLVVHPPALLDAWLGDARRLCARVASLRRREAGGWSLLDAEGRALLEADVVCLAAGAGVDALLEQPLPLTPVRGQVSWAEGLDLPTAAAWIFASPISPTPTTTMVISASINENPPAWRRCILSCMSQSPLSVRLGARPG
jgi:glycine/D-amino acid oxidase-like deaminating enzyme